MCNTQTLDSEQNRVCERFVQYSESISYILLVSSRQDLYPLCMYMYMYCTWGCDMCFLCLYVLQDVSSTCAQCDMEWIKKVGDEQ